MTSPTAGAAVAGCPYCGRPNDAHAALDAPNPPSDGDYSICWGCGQVAIFTFGPFGLAVRKPTPAEAAKIAANETVRRALATRSVVLLTDSDVREEEQ